MTESEQLEAAMSKITISKDLRGSKYITKYGEILGHPTEMHTVSTDLAFHGTGNHEDIFKDKNYSERLDEFPIKTGSIRTHTDRVRKLALDIYYPPTTAQRKVIRDYIIENKINPDDIEIDLKHEVKDVDEQTMKMRLGVYDE